MKFVLYVTFCLIGSLLNDTDVLGASSYSIAGNGYCRDKTISSIGDINIAVPVNIHDNIKGNVCGDISIPGFQTAIAVEWITSILNGNDSGTQFIPGINIGYTIYDDCGLPARTSTFLTDIFQETTISSLRDCTNRSNDAITYAGVLIKSSASSSSQAIKMSYLDVPVISVNHYHQTYTQTPSVFFGQNSITDEIKAILQFMYESTWNFIAVVYTADTIGQEYYTELLKQSADLDNCYLHLALDENNANTVIEKLTSEQYNFANKQTFGVLYLGSSQHANMFMQNLSKTQNSALASKLMIILPSAVGMGVEITETIKNLKNDIFFISPYKETFDKFKDYFQSTLENDLSIHNPWKSDYINKMCSIRQLGVCKKEDLGQIFKQESNVDKTIAAMISYAVALKNMHETYCNGKAGLCYALIQNLTNIHLFLKKTNVDSDTLGVLASSLNRNVSFGFNDDNVLTLGEYSFDVQYQKDGNQKLIGEYTNGHLRLNPTVFKPTASICEEKCPRCLESEKFQFGFTPGDVYILGLFSIHKDATVADDDTSVFKCGDFRTGTNAILTVSAFLESVKSIRRKLGVKFGAIALDDCYNELNISALITELFSRKRILHEPGNKNAIDFSKVISVVGALSSRVTQRVADIMSSLHIPMISYGASATTLDNRIRYPYFLRTVPSDALQIEGIVNLLSSLNINYVGALYIDDAYGTSGISGVISEAKKQGICVTEPQIITEDSGSNDIKDILRNSYINKQVKVITIFSMDTIVQNIIGDSVLGDDSNSVLSNYAPIFISSEGWGTDLKLANKESSGSLIFTTDSSKQVSEIFSAYLQTLSPSNVTENPWIYRFWEDHFQCYMPRSFEKRYTSKCDVNEKLSKESAQSLSTDQRNVHTEIAVNAIGFAYERHTQTCDPVKCFKRTPEDASKFTKAIREIYIPLIDRTNFKPFKSDNNGNLGFTIHNIQRNDDTYSYVKVGSYNGTLSLQRNKLKCYDHLGLETPLQPIRCPINDLCRDVCFIPTPAPTSTPPKETTAEASSDIFTYVVGGIAGVLFLVVLLLVVIVFKALRSKESSKIDQHNSFQMESLSDRSHHFSHTSLDKIYHEAHPVDNTTRTSPNTHQNMAFQNDSSNSNHSMTSVPRNIVVTSESDSAGSNVVYSNMAHASSDSSQGQGNKYLSLESSNNSLKALEALTNRVLQPQSTQNQERSNDNGNLTYLSAEDLEINDEDENQGSSLEPKEKFVKSENTDLDTPSPMELVSQINRNMVVPPSYPINGKTKDINLPFSLPGKYNHSLVASPNLQNIKSKDGTNLTYLSAHDLHQGNQELHLGENGRNLDVFPVNGQVQRPYSLPGLRPIHISPLQENARNTENYLNLNDNDMYLQPVSDSLPTYQEHLLLQQQLHKNKPLNGETTYVPNVNNNPLNLKQKVIFTPSSSSPLHAFSYINGINMFSPTSSISSPSPSAMSLSPIQREALQTRMLIENPHYYSKVPVSSFHSPISSNHSPHSNISPLDSKRESPKSITSFSLSELDAVDDREEVII